MCLESARSASSFFLIKLAEGDTDLIIFISFFCLLRCWNYRVDRRARYVYQDFFSSTNSTTQESKKNSPKISFTRGIHLQSSFLFLASSSDPKKKCKFLFCQTLPWRPGGPNRYYFNLIRETQTTTRSFFFSFQSSRCDKRFDKKEEKYYVHRARDTMNKITIKC